MHLILKPVEASELDPIEITDSLFAVGRYEPPFSTYERAKVAKLSKRHARIFEQDAQIYVADLGSTNGTLLNAKPVDKEPQVVRSGDRISFGGLAYTIEIVGATGQTASAPLRLVLTPERNTDVLESIVVLRFPFLINKYSDTFARYKEVLPEQLAYISRRHAHFFVRDGNLYIEDLNSTNGTFVSGTQLDEHARQLTDGDTVAFGGDQFVYRVHVVAEADESTLATTQSSERLKDTERTIFIDSPTSFVDIYVGTGEQSAVDDDEDDDEHDGGAAKSPGVIKRSKIGRSFAFAAQLKTALLGEQALSRRSRWIIRTTLVLTLAGVGAGYYYWSNPALRIAQRELDDGAFLDAAIRANEYLSAHPDSDAGRELATKALLRLVMPEWTMHVETKDFDAAQQLITWAEQVGKANTDDDDLLELLGWATRVARFLDGRGRGNDLNTLLEEGMAVRELVGWWESDTRTHARELLRLSGLVAEFASIREQIYSDVRQLRVLDNEQRPVQAFRERLAQALNNRDIGEVRRAIEDLKEADARFAQSSGLDADADRMGKVFRAIDESRWLDAYGELSAQAFLTWPFAEYAGQMIGTEVPDRETVTRYDAVKKAWQEGRTEQVFSDLDQLAGEPWGSEAIALGKRYREVWQGYQQLIASRGQKGYDARLFEYSALLDRQADRFLVDRLQEDFQASTDLALAVADRHVGAAAKIWDEYQKLGGIRTEQRLENAVSSDFRDRAALLSNADIELKRGQQIFAQLNRAPSQRLQTLQAAVGAEVTLQRRSLENLPVLDPAVRKAKLALLPRGS